MIFNAGCWRRRLAVLVIATSWLTGCATAGFEANGLAACPPVVEYSREFQARAAEELAIAAGRIGDRRDDGGLRCHAGAVALMSKLKHVLLVRYSLRITLVPISASR